MAGHRSLQSINAALDPLATLTDLLSGEIYITVSAVLPLVHLIKKNILKEGESDTTLTCDIKRKIKQDLRNQLTLSWVNSPQ